ncbi:hypothetical protein ACFQZE_13850 [Paenibacillus sp. GCM10027627]|uniref:hypothetical protein n=1 Tax=unclassified Paenibacillus TaxID=185978 RepID=UPI003640BBFE
MIHIGEHLIPNDEFFLADIGGIREYSLEKGYVWFGEDDFLTEEGIKEAQRAFPESSVGISITITFCKQHGEYVYLERPYVAPTALVKRNSQVEIAGFYFYATLNDDGEVTGIIRNCVFFTFWDSNLEFACQSSSETITDGFLDIYKRGIFGSEIEKFSVNRWNSNHSHKGAYIFVETEGSLLAKFIKQGRKYDVELSVVET